METRTKKRKIDSRQITPLLLKVDKAIQTEYDSTSSSSEYESSFVSDDDSNSGSEFVLSDEEEVMELNESVLGSELYQKFKPVQEIMNNREMTIKDILTADISDEQKANLCELYECLQQIPTMTHDYLDARNDLNMAYKKALVEKKMCSQSQKSSCTSMITDGDIYRKKLADLCINKVSCFAIMDKIAELESCGRFGEERGKLEKWLKTALALPHDRVTPTIDVNHVSQKINEIKAYLDKELFGMELVKERILLFLNMKLRNQDSKGCNLALVGMSGVGKCLGRNTPVLMFDGSIKFVQNIKVGDYLMGDDSTPRSVLSLARGREKMYEIRQAHAVSYVVNESHILSLESALFEKVDINVLNYQKSSKVLKGYKVPVDFPNAREIDIGEITSFGEQVGLFSPSFHRIPNFYKTSDVKNRLLLLTSIENGNRKTSQWADYRYPKIYPEAQELLVYGDFYDLQSDIEYVAHSLGFYTVKTKQNDYCRISILHDSNTSITVVPLEEDDYYGFMIDGNHRFLLGDFTVTHNTQIARCLSKCLELPFAQISFGSVTNVEFLHGHDFTYVGSKMGEISRSLTHMGSKNGILYMDEIDKAVDSRKEIGSCLLHLSDFTQNHEFRDAYLPEIVQDLSHIWFIYSMNKLPEDSALLDRLEIIHVSGYTIQERLKITEDFVFPKYLAKFPNLGENILMDASAFKYIVQLSGGNEELKGIRQIEQMIQNLLEKVYFFICNREQLFEYSWFLMMKKKWVNEKLFVDEVVIQEILKTEKKLERFHSMYM